MTAEHDLLLKMYNAFNARDIDTVLAGMHRDVDWPNGWERGRIHGHQAIRDYWTRQWKAVDLQVDPIAFDSDNAGCTIVRLHELVRDLEGNFISVGVLEHVFRMEDGLVRSMEIRGTCPEDKADGERLSLK